MTYLPISDMITVSSESPPAGLSLFITTSGEGMSLLYHDEHFAHGVTLGGQGHDWLMWALDRDSSTDGLAIPGVGIEVDIASAFDPGGYGAKGGVAHLEGGMLFLTCFGITGGRKFFSRAPIDMSGTEDQRTHPVVFSRWQLVHGEGLERRVLLAFADGEPIDSA